MCVAGWGWGESYLLITTVTGPITNNVVDYWFHCTVMDLHQ